MPIREIDFVIVASDVIGRHMDVAEIKEKILNMRRDVVLCTISIRVDSTSWLEFIDTLRGINTSKGNCILVTTHMKRVASTIPVDLHMLGRLTRDHCWSIFNQRAFVDGEVPEEVVSMKNRIVEMCQGLPLAASVLGGLLRNK
ncbi:putative disease resistance protein RGA3 [Solanum verrucosum]|uniref:putative disease resistance protein RGA3 n=1 Tax=Solanum verrucosum TaxID=315347 RepID=UPI0020D06ED2|nr:putative disease resistance protein RGA3 [Solanum verrucosum]